MYKDRIKILSFVIEHIEHIGDIMEKICSKCMKLKGICCFNKDRKNKDGHQGWCKICMKGYQKGYQKEYYQNNKEEINEKGKEKSKKYRLDHKEERKEKSKKYRLDHKEEINRKAKEYYENNKEDKKEYCKNNKDRRNEKRRGRKRILSDNAKIARLISNAIRMAVKAGGAKKCDLSAKLLGCTIDFYRDHIESKFTKGMTWENQGMFGWHFDHIRPCKSFELKDPSQQYICFNYTNVQPLWATTAIAMSYGEGSEYVGNLEKGCIF